MTSISVLIADDHEIVRYGISTFLSSSKDIDIVGKASSGDECLELFKKEQPDVCLLDISMPKKNGIETALNIRNLDADTKIIILSMHIDEQLLNDALEADINGYLLKNTDKADILNGIRAVMKGQQIFSDPISNLIKKSFLNQTNSKDKHKELSITTREQEILQLIVDGFTSKEIAEKLYISPRTVDTHRANLMEKLELKNIAELVRYALEHDLVSVG
ncbi:response regulator transcription factor [Fodinibius halophilus]|uniref:Response regulator transcription factor n=1 Tax=Fodinibius halophilus TaxID=1736908 RepID=A0A6M1T6Y2_9BACT|nr:response regulator transcription factor [Fodinibius halophilus]NGP88403.1 response regulator transcription factor [Fodinibius halophilus]